MKKSILILVILLILGSFSSCNDFNTGYYIFSSVDDFTQIEENCNDEIKIKKYDSYEKDEYMDGLVCSKFYAAQYSSKEFKFEIFAYEFENADVSKQYFKSAADRESEENTNFLEWGGLGHSEIVVINDQCAYVVLTSTPSKTKEFLSQIFSIRI